MKFKISLALFLLISGWCFSQKKINHKLDVFGGIQANIGMDLRSIIHRERDDGFYSQENEYPSYFSYGFTGDIGYQPLNWFALSGGIRYSYISPKFHNIYWQIQPYFFISNPKDEEFAFIMLNFGKQINTTQGFRNNGFIGLGIGKIDVINKNFGQKLQLSLDVQAGDDSVLFVGISYGIMFYSNKSL